jgi:hypothetical protein
MQEDTIMRRALAKYFEDNHFGDDGGYGETWVDFKLGPIPFPFPNTPMRVRAVKYHDMHHLITGYATDLPGELEIAGWEVGAGCRDYLVPWQLNLGGMAGGIFFMPRRVFRAFVRGRRSDSLYGRDHEKLLDMSVGECKRLAKIPAVAPRARLGDVLLFGLALLAGLVVGTLTLAMGLVTLPIAYLAFAKKARAARAASSPAG